MKQRGCRQPGHQAGILHRIPEPPAAPTQLIIGPIGSGGDPQRQKEPRTQDPGPHRPGESRPNFARNQRADGKAEGHRQANIADVKRRRMEGQARILQQRVQPCPLDRGGAQPRERVR